MLTMMRVMNSWGLVEDMSSLLESYRLQQWDSQTGERYIVEPATNSGFMISSKAGVKVVVSGVTYETYYEEEKECTLMTDLKHLYKELKMKERINQDRLNNVMVFLEDVATRDQVGVEVPAEQVKGEYYEG